MAKRFSEEQRASFLARFERWEGSAAAFCRKHGLSCQSLRNWRRTAASKPETPRPARFVELELGTRSGDGSGADAPRRPVAELDLGSGVVLRVFPAKESQP